MSIYKNHKIRKRKKITAFGRTAKWYDHTLVKMFLGFILTGLIIPYIGFNYNLYLSREKYRLAIVEARSDLLDRLENECNEIYSNASVMLGHFRINDYHMIFDDEIRNEIRILNDQNTTSKAIFRSKVNQIEKNGYIKKAFDDFTNYCDDFLTLSYLERLIDKNEIEDEFQEIEILHSVLMDEIYKVRIKLYEREAYIINFN